MQQTYLEPTQQTGLAFIKRNIEGPVVMLNLLKFKEVADYSASPNWRKHIYQEDRRRYAG